MHSLSTLTAEAEAYLSERADVEHRRWKGRDTTSERARLYGSHERLWATERIQQALERVEAANAPEEKLLARRLAAFLVSERMTAQTFALSAEIRKLEATATVETVDEIVPLPEALARMGSEPHRARRMALERVAGDFFAEHTAAFARRLDAYREQSERLGFENFAAVHERVTAKPLEPLLTEAEALLRHTEDAYRDLLGYTLSRVDGKLRPLPSGDAQRHDLTYATGHAPLLGTFRLDPFLRAVSRWLEELGLPSTARGNLRVDPDDRDGKPSGVAWFGKRFPGDVRLFITPASHPTLATAALRGLGQSLACAFTSPKLPFEWRAWTDAGLTSAYGQFFSFLLTDALWLHRYLEMPREAATETARAFAFESLRELRQRAAMLAHTVQLHRRGVGPDTREQYTERLRSALYVDVPGGFFLRDVRLPLEDAPALEGSAWLGGLVSTVEARFNEDYWRNPATGQFLQTLFAAGGSRDAAAHAEASGVAPPSLVSTATRLMQVMGR